MVSPPSTAERTAPPRHARHIRLRSQLDHFPHGALNRWMLRLLFALPLLATALATHVLATPLAGTPNAALVARVAEIDWTRADVAWLGQISPPISTLIAAVVPGGRLGLAILGALVGGIFVQKVVEIMVQRHFHRSTTVILTIALVANPFFFYTATENFAGFLGLIFFGLGVSDVVRFASWGNTQSGFRAGILFMLATLSDPSGLLYVATAVVAVPFISLRRRGQPGARASTALVIAYPTLAAVFAIVTLNLLFLGDPIGELGGLLTEGIAERWASLPQLFSTLTGWLLVAPVVSAWLVSIIVGRWKAIPVSTLVFAAIMAAYVIGLIPAGSAGNTFILMTLLAMAFIPTAKTRGMTVLLDLVAVGQIIIAWAAALNRPIIVEWLGLLGI